MKAKKLSIKRLLKKLRNKCYKMWRMRVLERWGGVCVVCGSTKLPNCHHIVPKEPPAFAALRYDPINGIVMCPTHHKFGKFSAHKNPLWFVHFLRLKVPQTEIDYLVKKMNECVEMVFDVPEYERIIKKLEITEASQML